MTPTRIRETWKELFLHFNSQRKVTDFFVETVYEAVQKSGATDWQLEQATKIILIEYHSEPSPKEWLAIAFRVFLELGADEFRNDEGVN